MKKVLILTLLILTLLTSCNNIQDNIKIIEFKTNQEFYFKKAISLSNYEVLNDSEFNNIPVNKNTILLIKDKYLEQENSIFLYLSNKQYIQVLNSNIQEIIRKHVFSNFKYIYKSKSNEEQQSFNIFLNHEIKGIKNNKGLYFLFNKDKTNKNDILVYFEAKK